MKQNPNCDGGHCRETTGEVRRLPTGGDSAVILCADCYCHEVQFRRERNRELEEFCKFKLPRWSELEVYLPATEAAPASGLTWKLYECSQCGTLDRKQTNHFGQCYSWGRVNVCPTCPPYKRPTTWICVEPKPEGAWVPPDWKLATLTIKKG